jgi:hypothetical protein
MKMLRLLIIPLLVANLAHGSSKDVWPEDGAQSSKSVIGVAINTGVEFNAFFANMSQKERAGFLNRQLILGKYARSLAGMEPHERTKFINNELALMQQNIERVH